MTPRPCVAIRVVLWSRGGHFHTVITDRVEDLLTDGTMLGKEGKMESFKPFIIDFVPFIVMGSLSVCWLTLIGDKNLPWTHW